MPSLGSSGKVKPAGFNSSKVLLELNEEIIVWRVLVNSFNSSKVLLERVKNE